MRRLAGRLVCRAGSHPYHLTDAPPAVAGVCDIDGSELYQRDDDREDVVRNRVAVFERDTMPVREHYRALGTPVVTIDGARAPEAVEADLTAAVRALEAAVILRKSRRELERMAAAGSVVARTLALLRDTRAAGRDDGASSTASPRSSSAARAACRPSRATTASRPRSASRRTTWSCTASPVPTCSSEGDVLSVDVGVTLRGWVADSGYTFWVGEGDPPEDVRRLLDGLPRVALRGARAVRRRPPPVRSRPRRADARRGGRLRRDPLAGRPRGGAAHARGPADPELRAAGPRARAAPGDDARGRADDHRQRRDRRRARRGRRLVDLQRRSLAHGALRAHRRRDRRRAARSSRGTRAGRPSTTRSGRGASARSAYPDAGLCYHAASRFAAACPLGQTRRTRFIRCIERES